MCGWQVHGFVARPYRRCDAFDDELDETPKPIRCAQTRDKNRSGWHCASFPVELNFHHGRLGLSKTFNGTTSQACAFKSFIPEIRFGRLMKHAKSFSSRKPSAFVCANLSNCRPVRQSVKPAECAARTSAFSPFLRLACDCS